MPVGGIPDSILDDSLLRFLNELDSEEMKDFVRVFFKIEEAHWFYLDHYCESNPILPKVNGREFCELVCHHVPYLQRFVTYFDDHWKAWKDYKANIPTAGAILLDETLEYVLVIESFSRRFGFPKGKRNNDETMQQCAVREVLEETGYDISNKITPDEYLELACDDMFVQLFIVHGIPRDTVFMPQTRGEVKSFAWMPIKDLPGATGPQTSASSKYKAQAYYMIRPFINPLRRWIDMNRKVILGEESTPSSQQASPQKTPPGCKTNEAYSPPSSYPLSPGKMLEIPLSVQRQAAARSQNSVPSSPSAAPVTPPKFMEKSKKKESVAKQNNNACQNALGSRPKFPLIEFEDFVPKAWSPGAIGMDGLRFFIRNT